MLHDVRLLFGYDTYYGDIEVSPYSMLTLLKEPFSKWLYLETWKNYRFENLSFNEFHLHTSESTAHFNSEDFYFDPKCAEWAGFRLSLDQSDAEVEFVFAVNLIAGEIRPDIDKISANLLTNLNLIGSTIRRITSEIKRNKDE